ncbi:MAG: Nif3-like dinuclear metal center hexameric protein, partial [Proteobacteria bacterium]|nr:Nif3-like dinuclear metal center hexameric protein [Pseudomonadota bacterium]
DIGSVHDLQQNQTVKPTYYLRSDRRLFRTSPNGQGILLAKLGAGKMCTTDATLKMDDIISYVRIFFQQFGGQKPTQPLKIIRPFMNHNDQADEGRGPYRVAAICGVASDFITDCAGHKIDLLICGELRYHECVFLQEVGCNVILLGHHRSEHFAMDMLASVLRKKFAKLPVKRSQTDRCPVEYDRQ